MRYWLKYDGNEPYAIYRFGDNQGEYANLAGQWQTDNRMLAQTTGVGGDTQWKQVTEAKAAAYLAERAPAQRSGAQPKAVPSRRRRPT